MRDRFVLRPFGNSSIRNFLLSCATIIVATFAYLFFVAPTVNAATDVTWSSTDLVYQANTYLQRADIATGSSTGLAAGTKVYTFFSPSTAAPGVQQKAQIIYFTPGTDPTTASTAHFVIYNFVPPDGYSNPTGKKDLSMTAQSQATTDKQTTSCAVEGGLGWVICPLTKTLSAAMDWIFGIIASFLEVQPVQTDTQSPLYRAWSMMRNIANVAFVMAFLVVIYSQLTNLGLSNYGLKRIMPRLIVAAILVNVSYWICAIGVDLSNIAGHSVQDIFNSMRNGIVGPGGNGWNIINWQSLGGLVLSGGTATIAGVIGLHSLAAGAAGSIWMLLPVLLGVMLAALVALLVMAARQALITILIVVAPLAFVAYLLPNTEKYFKKWHELFSTMLIVFPAVAFVFSGAQLAGDLIIQSADSITVLILGMAVKIAPIAITPLLMKVSGSLLGKFAGIVNNPSKGMLDRTRNKAQELADQRKAKALAQKNPKGIAAIAQGIEANKRKREGWKKAYEGRADAKWAGSEAYSDIHQYDGHSSELKEIGEAAAKTRHAIEQRVNAESQALNFKARAAKVTLDIAESAVETNWDELKAGDDRNVVRPANLSSAGLQRYLSEQTTAAQTGTLETAVEARRAASAKNMQQNEISRALQNDAGLRLRAGGIDPNGGQRALADALKKQHEIRGEAVTNANSIIDHSNVNPDELVSLSTGNSAKGIVATEDVQEAAIKRIASGSNVKAIQDMLDKMNINNLTENHRIALSDSLLKNGAKPKFVSASASEAMAHGNQPLGKQGVDDMILAAAMAGKYSPEVFANQDEVSLRRVLDAIKTNRAQYPPEVVNKLFDNIMLAKSDPILRTKLGEREGALDKIVDELLI